MDVVLGFDTSCYTTSVAAVDGLGNVLDAQRMLLPVEHGKRGLRQSEAVFVHVRQLPLVMEALAPSLKEARVCALAASNAPRHGEDSYMPVFAVGHGQARSLAAALGVPCYGFSHQQGHIAAGRLGGQPLDNRFLALHLSGGTTELLAWEGDAPRLVGGTLDLHAGQLVDRVGVALGLPFPAGPALEALAMECQSPAVALLPLSLEQGDLHCHFSGAETRAQQYIAQGMPPAQLALEVFDLLARTVQRMLVAGAGVMQTRQALVVGGVASSTLLRRLLLERLAKGRQNLQVVFGQAQYSADNAAGIAWLGAQKHFSENSF